jgi:DNA-directed RNA polymerase subunit RPC12/RpoP
VELNENDIIFNCPHCGKSLAIDKQGAGLMIACTDCGERIRVPVPEGVEDQSGNEEPEQTFQQEPLEETADDIPADEDPRDHRIAELEAALMASQSKVQELVQGLKEVYNRRNYLEQMRVEHLERFDKINREIRAIQDALDRLVAVMDQSSAINDNAASN